jgi:hypothetical protein
LLLQGSIRVPAGEFWTVAASRGLQRPTTQTGGVTTDVNRDVRSGLRFEGAKRAEGEPRDAGIRIRLGRRPLDPDEPLTGIGFAISDGPESGDEEFEQDGLRIFCGGHVGRTP